jgi:hypothetical protein
MQITIWHKYRDIILIENTGSLFYLIRQEQNIHFPAASATTRRAWGSYILCY